MNKKNLLKLTIALLIPVIYAFSITGLKSVSNENFKSATLTTLSNAKNFLNIIFNVKYGGVVESNWVERNLNRYRDSLNYNAIQIYDEGSTRFGTFELPLTGNQISNVTNLMTDIDNKDLKGIYSRTKIFRLGEGQRLIYEISGSGSNTINDGFSYQNVMSNTYTIDSGRTVLHAKTWPSANQNSAGWLCKNIYENVQHSDYINGKDKGDWFIKPMMRIDQSDFDETDTTKVVAIVVNDFNGDRLDSIIVKVRNFRNSNNEYFGNYIDEFNFQNEFPLIDLTISGTDLNYGNTGHIHSSMIDFKVYWFGQVDVWFDKMIVDDDMGDLLFEGDFDDEIQDEVTNFTSQPSNYTFYCDEVVYSQIPCLEYLKNKMIDFDPDAKLSYVMSNGQNRHSLRNDTVAYGPSLRKVNPEIFFSDPYVIPWEIPNNLNFAGAQQLSPGVYNDTLQRIFGDKNGSSNIFEGSFIIHHTRVLEAFEI